MVPLVKRSIALLAALLALPALAGDVPPAAAWRIGPVIDGRNYSQGMPPRPSPSPEGWHFDFPHPDARAGHVHYLTFDPGSLREARELRLHYRIEAAPGVRFVPQEFPQHEAILSLYFQRRGDDWRARGEKEYYRWYAPAAAVVPLERGEHVVTVPLEDEWISVYGKPRSEAPRAFAAALAEAGSVGFVLGSAGGRGHGVYATGPARMIVLDFAIVR